MSEEKKQKPKEYQKRKYLEAKKSKYNNEWNSFFKLWFNSVCAIYLAVYY